MMRPTAAVCGALRIANVESGLKATRPSNEDLRSAPILGSSRPFGETLLLKPYSARRRCERILLCDVGSILLCTSITQWAGEFDHDVLQKRMKAEQRALPPFKRRL
jgi:hypothetical protein